MVGMNTQFYAKLQRYVVNSGIDISVLRRQPAGTVKAAQEFLYAIDLGEFADRASFATVLDEQTVALRDLFTGASWGHARKCLNIFLRKALYDHYLRRMYGLGSLEPVLELPLDSHVARGIRHDAKCLRLNQPPTWKTITGLTRDDNAKWQAIASQIAQAKKIERVHLDLWYWRAEPICAPNSACQCVLPLP